MLPAGADHLDWILGVQQLRFNDRMRFAASLQPSAFLLNPLPTVLAEHLAQIWALNENAHLTREVLDVAFFEDEAVVLVSYHFRQGAYARNDNCLLHRHGLKWLHRRNHFANW